MASPSPGWLIAEGDSPTRRALDLFGTFLDEEQRSQVERYGGFAHEEGTRLYWLPIQNAPRCVRFDSDVIIRYCIAPKEKRSQEPMPGPDVALTHLLWLRADPVGFRKEANVLASADLPEGLTREELLGHLSNMCGNWVRTPRTRGPAYRPFRREPRLSPEQRAAGIAKARDLAVGLQLPDLKEFFARNNVEVSDETLRKLARASR